MLINTLQEKMVSLQSVFACVFLTGIHKKIFLHNVECAFLIEENADLHTSQENGFPPLCVHMCSFMSALLENADRHTSQENGFSPVWVLMWIFKL